LKPYCCKLLNYMNNNTFKYSILKYRPSYLLDERLNIALLFYFEEGNELLFIHPSRLVRLSYLVTEAPVQFIKKYLKNFKQKTKKLSRSLDYQDFSSKFLAEHYLVPDANSFFFSDIKVGKYSSREQIIQYYTDLYLGVYKTEIAAKHNEQYIIKKINASISEYAQTDFFDRDVIIENKIKGTKFDFGWQNEQLNLIKPISFDLGSKDTIQRKSFRWYGELSQLTDIALRDNLNFDLIVAPPQNTELIDAYQAAFEVFESLECPKRIIKTHQIPSYIKKVSNEITKTSIAA